MKINEIKMNARERLIPHLGNAAITTLVYLLICNFISLCANLFASGNSILAFIFFYIGMLIPTLLIGQFNAGLSHYYLNLNANETPRVGNLFYSFTNGPDKTLRLTLFFAVLEMICFFPYAFYSCFVAAPISTETINLTILLQQLGINSLFVLISQSILFLVKIPFILSYFILVDMPQLSTFKILRMSAWLMKGNFFKYIGLSISFFPLMLISFISFGVGDLWLQPYIQTSLCVFYLDLTERKAK